MPENNISETGKTLEKLKEGIYRIKIPFEEIYTSSFILIEGNELAVLDSGDSAFDAETYIIPILKRFDASVRYIVTSHSHGDHSGGRERLTAEYPNAECVDFFTHGEWNDGDMILHRFMLIGMKGHSLDGLAVYDTKTKTLLTCDALQQQGVGKYRNGVYNKTEYLLDIEQVRALSPETLIASHNYDPIGHIAEGKEKITELLQCCSETL